ncbi:MAG TPA: hypothetical protein VEX11_02150 [Acetobacteraceae bacterium]|nr:hypothetical protein [Acetobacteraceae bacterium]
MAVARVGIIGLEGQIELEALRLRAVAGTRQGDHAEASLASSTGLIELDATA